MTNRHAGYIVTLSKDVREDDAEQTINAIRMVKGVADVAPIVAEVTAETIARGRRDLAWSAALADLARSGPGPACPQYRGGAVHRPHDGCPGYHWD